MTRLRLRKPGEWTAVAAAIIMLFSPLAQSTASATPWRISLDGADVTGLAVPFSGSREPLVNVAALGSTLGLSVQASDNVMLCTDRAGNQWRADNGGISMECVGRSISLSSPAVIQGASCYLPIRAVAELGGLGLQLDASTGSASLETARPPSAQADEPPSQAPTDHDKASNPGRETYIAERETFLTDTSGQPPPGAADGWQEFSVEKTPQQKAESDSEEPVPATMVGRGPFSGARLPDEHDKIHLGVGLGYVQGTDFGSEITATGRFAGVQVNFGTLLTAGEKGIRPSTGHLYLVDNDSNRSAEAGMLVSDLWGQAQGLRYSWLTNAGQTPSMSLYVKSRGAQGSQNVMAFSNAFTLGRSLSLGGEVASNGAVFAKSHFQTGRLSFYEYRAIEVERSPGRLGKFFRL